MSTTSRKLITATMGAVIAFAGAAAIGLFITDAMASSAREPTRGTKVNTSVKAPATADFPTNNDGLTYGSDAFVHHKSSPDLVAVVGDNGVAGYVKRKDLEGPNFSTPEQALLWQKQNPGDIVIDVYDVNGERVIDTFTLVVPMVEER